MNMGSYRCCEPNKQEYNKISSLSSLLKLVGEESRLKILCLLNQGEHCVCELTKHTRLSQSLISHHLKSLKDADLIKDRKEEQWVHYSLTIRGKKLSRLLFKLR